MSTLIDYAWQKPTPAAIVAAGYAGVLRYLSLDASKNLGPAERDALHAAGLGIGLVWETTATRAGQGYSAGQQDVQAAEAQADALGYPADCPIFYAVDYGATVAAVLPYFQGVQGLASHPVGVYGSASIVEGVTVAPWKWQTVAWSGGRISPAAHIYQTLDPSLPGCDHNRVLQPIPLWTASETSGLGGVGAGTVTIPAAPTFPNQPPATTSQEDDMMLFTGPDGTVYAASATRSLPIANPAVSAALNKARAGGQLAANELAAVFDVQAQLRDPLIPVLRDSDGTLYAVTDKVVTLTSITDAQALMALRDGAGITADQAAAAARVLGS